MPNNSVYLIIFDQDFTVLATDFQEEIFDYLATKRNISNNVTYQIM